MTGLISSLNAALSGLNSAQQSLGVIASDIANANTPGHTNVEAKITARIVNGQVVGSEVTDVIRKVNDLLLEQARSQNAASGKADKLKELMDNVMFMFGQPGLNNDLNAKVENFFDALANINDNPGDTIAQTLAIKAADDMADFISNTATDLVNFQFEVDQEIAKMSARVNDLLSKLRDINVTLSKSVANPLTPNGVLDERDRVLDELSTLIDIRASFDDNGRTSLALKLGNTEVSLMTAGGAITKLGYEAAFTEDTFINLATLNPIQVQYTKADGTVGFGQDVIPGGKANTNTLEIGGALGALLQVRDQEIPNILDLLNNYATTLLNELNAIHNDGAGFPPASTLTGTKPVASGDLLDFSGSTLFAIVNKATGGPVSSPYSNDTVDNDGNPVLPSFSLDWDKLEGSATTGHYIKAFNEYYNELQPTASLGPLDRLSIRGSSASGGPPYTSFSFNLDAFNSSAGAANIVVNGVATIPALGVSSSIPASLSGGTSWAAGEQTWSEDTIDLTLPGTENSYEVTLDVTVTDADGNVTNATITVTVDMTAANDTSSTGLIGEIYGVDSVTGDATRIVPSPATSIAQMSIVDENGNTITNGTTGFLKVTATSSAAGIAIAEQDAAETVTGRGFSHYFGLNDLFTEEYDTISGSSTITKNKAFSFGLTESIANNPSLFSRGGLQQSLAQNDDTLDPLYSYELASGNADKIQQFIDKFLNQVSFSSAGGLTATNATLGGYAATITEFTAFRTEIARTSREQEEILRQGIAERRESEGGVNVDEELANMLRYQNSYQAAARIVTVINALFDEILNLAQ